MATIAEIRQAYLDTLGYIPPRLDGLTDADAAGDNVQDIYDAFGGGASAPAPTTATPVAAPTPTGATPTATSLIGQNNDQFTTGTAPLPNVLPGVVTTLPVPTTNTYTGGAADMSVPLWVKGKAGLEEAWIEAWIDTGDVMLAREAVRAHSSYDTYFAGNKRDDGTVRITEEQHASVLEGYQQALISVGLNPGIFSNSFGTLVENDVDVREFVDRIEAVRAGIIDRAPAVAEYYTDNYGIDMTPEAVYASLLDPTVAEGLVGRTIAISQIGAAASEHGFGIGITAAEQLVNRDLDIFTARRFFGEAEAMLPALGTLVARHNDPDDTFDLGEFTQAEIMNDPEQRRRIRRLLSQEASTFSQGAGQAGAISRNRGGGLSGLADR